VQHGIPAVGEVSVTFLEIDEGTELAAFVRVLVDKAVDQVSFLGSDPREGRSVVRDSPAESLGRFLIASCLEHEPRLTSHVAGLFLDTDVTIPEKAEIPAFHCVGPLGHTTPVFIYFHVKSNSHKLPQTASNTPES
jgi:hypothetical protein